MRPRRDALGSGDELDHVVVVEELDALVVELGEKPCEGWSRLGHVPSERGAPCEGPDLECGAPRALVGADSAWGGTAGPPSCARRRWPRASWARGARGASHRTQAWSPLRLDGGTDAVGMGNRVEPGHSATVDTASDIQGSSQD